MKQVLVVKSKGPGFEEIIRNGPLIGEGGTVSFTVIPNSSEKHSHPDTFFIQGRIVGTFKSDQYHTWADNIVLFVHLSEEQNVSGYFIVNYNYRRRTGGGVIYDENEFFELPLLSALAFQTS